MSELYHDTRIVEKVRVVVHTTGAWPNGMSDNHWSIYFILSGGVSSIRMNMSAERKDPRGILSWSSTLLYTETKSAIQYWDYDTVPGSSIGNIYWLVMSKGRDKYIMSAGGSGCRWWV